MSGSQETQIAKIHPKKVLIRRNILDHTFEEEKQYAEKGLETGSYLLGKIYRNMVCDITHWIDAGPKAQRGPTSFVPDEKYATQKKEELRAEDPDIRLLSTHHLHPWHGKPWPSGIDLEALRDASTDRPWYFLMVSTKDGFNFFDLNDGGDGFTEIPYQVIPSGIEQRLLIDRIRVATQQRLLMDKTVMLVGLGSVGSVEAKYLGNTGIGRFILIDFEELESVNVIRHEGTIFDIGKPKTDICKTVIESHNPFTVVETYNMDVTKEIEKLEELAKQSDLIVGSSGSPKINHILNKISVKNKIPAIYCGIYEKASGGYVLAVYPQETACFNCLFNITSQAYHLDREEAARYGLSDDELHSQQGLWIDISIPALFMAKTAVKMLHGEKPEFNLLLYDSDPKQERRQVFPVRAMKMLRREDCAVCNFEGWARKQTEQVKRPQLKQSIFSKAKQWLIEMRAR